MLYYASQFSDYDAVDAPFFILLNYFILLESVVVLGKIKSFVILTNCLMDKWKKLEIEKK